MRVRRKRDTQKEGRVTLSVLATEDILVILFTLQKVAKKLGLLVSFDLDKWYYYSVALESPWTEL